MQGRLVHSTSGELDCSPGTRWREEFGAASALGLHHIELVADRQLDHSNPLWSDAGRDELIRLAEATGVDTPSICLNEALSSPIDQIGEELIDRITSVVQRLPVRIVVLPLLEASDLSSRNRNSVIRSIRRLADQLLDDGRRLVLEMSLSARESLRFLDAIGSLRVGLCYDVGNATASGFDPADELSRLGPAVWHLHAKDKSLTNENVRFGTGRVPFTRVFAELCRMGFDGLVTMEATRGDDPVKTAGEHRAFLLEQEVLGSHEVMS